MPASPKPWPPPPDLDSIQELVATADVEGFIASGAPADEYETEADLFFDAIKHLHTNEIVASALLPLLEDIWQSSFSLEDTGLAQRRDALLALATQVERLFGPEAKPQVR